MKYSGIIFDFNGVLLWDTLFQEEAWNTMAQKLRGKTMTIEEMNRIVHGRPNCITLEYLLDRKLSQIDSNKLTQEKESIYRKLCLDRPDDFKLSKGAVDLLDFLKQAGIPRTIATASEKTNVHFFIQHLHLETWFDTKLFVYDDGTIPGKPAPDVYRKAAMNIMIQPEKCIVVEDSLSGLVAANKAGIGRIFALGPKASHETLKNAEGTTDVISNLAELPRMIFNTEMKQRKV